MAQVAVLCSGAFRPAYELLAPAFERASGHTSATAWGSSVAGMPTSIPDRLVRGEPADLVIMAGQNLDQLIAAGLVATGSRVDLAGSGIGLAVRAGAPRPDIGSAERLTESLLRAGSIAHSTSASGIYIKGLLARLGVTPVLGSRIRAVTGEPVGKVVARGEAEIGFQQMSELLPVAGIDIVGPLPSAVQEITMFAAGIAARAQNPEAARALVAYLRAADAHAVIRKTGMEPA